jgi:hypothetical protein
MTTRIIYENHLVGHLIRNGTVYDPKTNRKYRKNEAFTAVYSSNTVRFRFVLNRILISFSSVKIANIHFPLLFQVIQKNAIHSFDKYLLFNLLLKIL